MDSFLIVQILGFICVIIGIISLQMPKKEHILLFHIVMQSLYLFQYLIQKQYSGMAVIIVGIISFLVFYFYKQQNRKPSAALIIIALLAMIGLNIWTWAGWISLLPLLAGGANTYGKWQDNMKFLRVISVFTSILWLVYDLQAKMYMSCVNDTMLIASSAVAIWRYDIRKSGQL